MDSGHTIKWYRNIVRTQKLKREKGAGPVNRKNFFIG